MTTVYSFVLLFYFRMSGHQPTSTTASFCQSKGNGHRSARAWVGRWAGRWVEWAAGWKDVSAECDNDRTRHSTRTGFKKQSGVMPRYGTTRNS